MPQVRSLNQAVEFMNDIGKAVYEFCSKNSINLEHLDRSITKASNVKLTLTLANHALTSYDFRSRGSELITFFKETVKSNVDIN